MPLLPASTPSATMAGATRRRNWRRAWRIRAGRTRVCLVFILISVGFGVLHLHIRKSDIHYSGTCKLFARNISSVTRCKLIALMEKFSPRSRPSPLPTLDRHSNGQDETCLRTRKQRMQGVAVASPAALPGTQDERRNPDTLPQVSFRTNHMILSQTIKPHAGCLWQTSHSHNPRRTS